MTMNYCQSCFRNATYYGEIFHEHDLILDGEIYKIVSDHDEIVRFPSKPPKDPFEGLSDEEAAAKGNTLNEEFLKYSAYDAEFRKKFVFSPQQGHHIVECCKKSGYDPNVHGWLDYWVVDRAYNLIQKSEDPTA